MAWNITKSSIRARVMEKLNPLIAKAEADWEVKKGEIYDNYQESLKIAAEARDHSLEKTQEDIISKII